MIYLASPYSHPDKKTMEQRYEAALAATAWYFNQGHFVYSPIAHCHEVAKRFELPTDFHFWQHYNRHMMQLAQSIHVLQIAGWEESKGVQAEIKFAQELGMDLHFFNPLTKKVLIF